MTTVTKTETGTEAYLVRRASGCKKDPLQGDQAEERADYCEQYHCRYGVSVAEHAIANLE